MAVRVTQTAYNSGELGEMMTGRVDDPKYASGLKLCKNALITPQGPIKNRSGFQFVREAKFADKQTLLVPFTYSADQTMIVELGDRYARFHTKGQTLLTADGRAPYEIETPWRAQDLFNLHYTQNADVMTFVCPGYPPQELRRYSINDWRLHKVTLLAALRPPTGVSATRISTAAEDKNSEKYTQYYVVTALNEERTEESEASARAQVVANLFATGTTVKVSWQTVAGARYYRVYKYQGGLYGYIGETVENWIVDDNIAPETGTTPPYSDDVFQVSGGITSAQILNGGSGYENGKRITGVLDYGKWAWGSWENHFDWKYFDWIEGRKHYGTMGALVLPWTSNKRNVGDGHHASASHSSESGSMHYRGIIDLEGNGTGATGNLIFHRSSEYGYTITGGEITNPGHGYKHPVMAWYMVTGVKNSTTHIGWMECLSEEIPVELEVYDEGGNGYGAKLGFSIENGVFTDVYVISPGRNYTNPKVRIVTINGSGASFKLNVGNAGDYPAAVGYFEQRRIFAGTRLRPQQIWMTATGTESNMTYHLPLQDTDRISFAVASRELNQIQHVVALQQLIMLTSAAEWRVSPLNSDAITPSSISVRPQSYIGASTVQPQVFNTNLLYAAARGGHVRELSYDYTAGGYITGDISIRAPHLFSEENVVTNMALTKSPDPYLWCVRADGVMLGLCYVPEQKVGAWFQIHTKGEFESASVVQEGKDDYLYVVVRRRVNGKSVRYVERQALRNDAGRGGCYLDSAGYFTSEEPKQTIAGLTWLEGETVTVLADGAVYKGLQVSKGEVTLPVPVSNAWIGLPYETVIETLPVTLNAQDGSLGRGHVKNVNRVVLRVYKTSGIEVGPDLGHMKPVKARTKEVFGSAPSLQTGEVDLGVVGGWQADGTFCIRQAEPLPFTLIYHSADVEIGG